MFFPKEELSSYHSDWLPAIACNRHIIEKRGGACGKHGTLPTWKVRLYTAGRHLLALRLGRRSVVDRLTKWREKAEKEEFPFPRNENFVGRKKELSELEFMLFGDVSGDAERDYFDIKARPRKKNLTIGWSRSNSIDEKRRERKGDFSKRKGKEPIVWKESDKDIEMQNTEFSQAQVQTPKLKGKNRRRRRSMKIIYGKGIGCVSGESGVEAMTLMQGGTRDYPIAEVDVLRSIEEKLGRLTLGLAIVGAILSELPISPSRLLDTINRMPSKDVSWTGREYHGLRRKHFLLQLVEVCFSIFDHAEGPRSLATRMVLASGWFAPSPIPVSLLALAAHKVPEKHHHRRYWRKVLCSLTCGFSSSYARKSEAEASSLLLRFNIARSCAKDGHIQFNQILKLYARKRGVIGVAQAMVQAVISKSSIAQHSQHIWAACFLIFGLGNEPVVVELKVSELLFLVKEIILPLAIRTFITFSRCSAALELLRVCTDALEAADEAFVTPVEKWLDKSLCWRPIQTNAQLNPFLWQELALSRATVLEIRAKLMMRGGQFDIGDDLIRKSIFIRTSICGEDHPDTVSAQETLGKITRLLSNIQNHTSP
ncbi:hypothetical protein Leryth_008925 [Lithospermum erythrorhizon]|nr:hypothetical protein Leryth_008925 [Lithospermum erythrorhizon]